VDPAADDYRLCESGIPGCTAPSPYKNAGIAGKDIGADIGEVNEATEGSLTGNWPPTGGQSPYNGTPFTMPGTFEAEHFDLGGEGVAYHDVGPGNAGGSFRTGEDVDIVAAFGNASGHLVNDFQTGEWLEYSVSIGTSGSYVVKLHVSSEQAASRFRVEIDGTDISGSVAVPNTGWWGTFQWVTAGSASLSPGAHIVRVQADAQYFNLDAIRLEASSPYSGTPIAVPGTFQAEHFDLGGEGVAYHDQVAGNAGGAFRPTEDVDIIAAAGNATDYVVNNFQTGEWLNYTISVGTAGVYAIDLAVSSEFSTSRFHVEVDGVDVTGSLPVPHTGSWTTFQWVGRKGIVLSAGQHILRVQADEEYFNLDAIRIEADNASDIVVYASDVGAEARHGSWTTAADATSPDAVKLTTPDSGYEALNQPLASPTHYADVAFTANAGTPYTLWLRLKATANSKWNDSVWVQFSDARVGGSPVYAMNSTSGLLVNLATDGTGNSLNGWGWANGAYWLSQPTTVTFGASGSQTLRVQLREDGVELDQIVLSPVTYLGAAPGPPTGDSTIVAKP
jgi:hypothetical protein